MTEQYWADACTQNPVWIIQQKDHDGSWYSVGVCLTEKEGIDILEARPHHYGKIGEDCKLWGVPCHGIMIDLLGQHNKEFEKDVEYITPYVPEGSLKSHASAQVEKDGTLLQDSSLVENSQNAGGVTPHAKDSHNSHSPNSEEKE